MIDRVEITKLYYHEQINSHLIRMGNCNIICDLPLNPENIINCKKFANDSINEKKLEESLEDMAEKLTLDKKNIPVTIHFILITNVEGFVGLPIFCKYFDLSKTEIICTKPTYYFALCVIQNLQKRETYLPLWEEDENAREKLYDCDENKYYNFDSSLRKNMHLLSYKEKINFKYKDVNLEFSCFSSGYALGSCNFTIKSNFISMLIIGKSCYKLKRYPSHFDAKCFENVDVVLFTSYMSSSTNWFSMLETNQKINESSSTNMLNKMKYDGKEQTEEIVGEQIQSERKNESDSKTIMGSVLREQIMQGNHVPLNELEQSMWNRINVSIGSSYKDSINKLCSAVIRAIKNKGCVLIPIDIYFLYFIELTELIGVAISKHLSREEQVTIYTILSNVNDAIYYAESCADWVDESRKEKCCRTKFPEHPFSFNMMKKNNRLIVGNTVQEVAHLFKYPCVCLIQDSSLRLFESLDVFKKWMNDDKNSIILVDTMYDPLKVLPPHHVLNAKITIFYCPINWQLNEKDILKIIHSNKENKCHYLLPHQLQPFFQKLDERLAQGNWKKNVQVIEEWNDKQKQSKLQRQGKKGEAADGFSIIQNKDKKILQQDTEGIATTTVFRKLKRTPLEKLLKQPTFQQTTEKMPVTHGMSDEEMEEAILEVMRKEIDCSSIQYLYAFKKMKIICNEFSSEMNKNMKAIRFFCDSQTPLEKIMNKAEGIYFAKVECQLTTSYMGDLVNAEDIHVKTEQATCRGGAKEAETRTETKEKKKGVATEDGVKKENDKIINPTKQENIGTKKKDQETIKYYKTNKKTPLMYGTIEAKDLKQYLINRGYKSTDMKIHYPHKGKTTPWNVKVKSLNGEIICHGPNDMEVFTTNDMLRQHVTEMVLSHLVKF